MLKPSSLALVAACLCAAATARGELFDFDNAPFRSSLPIALTAGGVTANLSATGQGFSIQQATSLSPAPAGFSGLCIYPNSVFAADLYVAFAQAANGLPQTISDFSILYAPQELACDSSARMMVTAYMNDVLVGTNTATANPPGTWPSATLSFSSIQGFNRVVVHYDAPPPTGGDWGPIFMADNMVVTTVPEPSALALLSVGAAAALLLVQVHPVHKPVDPRRQDDAH